AVARELGDASPGEIRGGDAAEHRAAVEPAEAMAERVPGAPHRERGLRLAARHEGAGEEVQPFPAEDDAVHVEERDACLHRPRSCASSIRFPSGSRTYAVRCAHGRVVGGATAGAPAATSSANAASQSL